MIVMNNEIASTRIPGFGPPMNTRTAAPTLRRAVTVMAAVLGIVGVVVLAPATEAGAVTQICGDVDGSGQLVATDALQVLGKAVGQNIDLECPSVCSTTTSTTSTTTTTMPSAFCGNAQIDPGEDCDSSDVPCGGGACWPNCRCDNFTTCGNGGVDAGETCDGSDIACVGGTCDLTLCTCDNECASGLDCSGLQCVGGLCATACASSAGCAGGQSCSGLVTVGQMSVAVCVDDNQGGAPLLDPCTQDEDCQSNLCFSNRCSVACQGDGDCGMDGSCQAFVGLPDLCTSGACDALAQDCPIGTDACFPDITMETTVCGAPFGTATQGDECQFINGCSKGYGCTLFNDAQTALVCAFICDALDAGGPSCADSPNPAFNCIALNDYWGDVDNMPPNLGLCVAP
jgi:hypothetical protein